jgi:hypothetical protein
MTDRAPEATTDPAPLTLAAAQSFSATSEVSQALGILRQIDSASATDAEISAVEAVLGPFSHDLARRPLMERIRSVNGCSLAMKGTMATNFDGTAGITALNASWAGETVSDTGSMAAQRFQDFLGGVPPDKRGEVGFRVVITAYMPKYPARLRGWTAPSVGSWVEKLAHELTVHAEPDVDAIATYRSGTAWPYQWQATQHWMFIHRGVPRYLLWLRRLTTGPNARTDLVPDFLTSLRGWAKEKDQAQVPESVTTTLNGQPGIVNLRQLAALLHLNPPAETGPNTDLVATLKNQLGSISAKARLWWATQLGQ